MNDPIQHDKVWIEIEPVEDRSGVSRRIAQERCAKANITLELLGIDSLFTVNPEYFDSEWKNKGHWADHAYYCTNKNTGEFMVLVYNGHWMVR